jgi:hypothetical protein
MSAVAVALSLCLGAPSPASADADSAKTLLKAMSDYLASQDVISFRFDSVLEIVTTDGQKLGLASSGSAALNRPDKIRAARSGGFADIELIFDGKTLTLLGKGANLYTQVEIPGSIDHLIDELRNTYHRPLPAADLLLSSPYEVLMADVVDIKDLGSGVVGGVECDSLAFRTDEVDWQIWIAHGDSPYPCRYVITTKGMAGSPQYSVQVTDWRTGDEAEADDFAFDNTSNAKEIALEDLRDALSDLPSNFAKGETQ